MYIYISERCVCVRALAFYCSVRRRAFLLCLCMEIGLALTRARVRRVCCRRHRQLAAAHVLLFVSSCCAAFWADFSPILKATAPNGRRSLHQRDGRPAGEGLEPKGRAELAAFAPTLDDFRGVTLTLKLQENSGKSRRRVFLKASGNVLMCRFGSPTANGDTTLVFKVPLSHSHLTNNVTIKTTGIFSIFINLGKLLHRSVIAECVTYVLSTF